MKKISLLIEDETQRTSELLKNFIAHPHVSGLEILMWDIDNTSTNVLYYFHTVKEVASEILREHEDSIQWSLSATGSGTYGIIRYEDFPQEYPKFAVENDVVLSPPIIIRDDGSFQMTFVGTQSGFDALIGELEDQFKFSINGFGDYFGPNGWGWITPRQRKSLEIAVDVGYFDIPRTGTMSDVAAELGCSESTASEHVRKAQFSIIRDLVSNSPLYLSE